MHAVRSSNMKWLITMFDFLFAASAAGKEMLPYFPKLMGILKVHVGFYCSSLYGDCTEI